MVQEKSASRSARRHWHSPGDRVRAGRAWPGVVAALQVSGYALGHDLAEHAVGRVGVVHPVGGH